MTLYNEWCKIKRYFPPTRDEALEFLLTATVIGFVISFNAWGDASFDVAAGLRNLGISVLLAALAVAAHHTAQRLFATYMDGKVEQRIWWGGMITSLILVFLSRGSLPFIAITRTTVSDAPYQRLGHYRYKIGTLGKMFIIVAGPAVNTTIAIVLWSISKAPPGGSPLGIFLSLNIWLALLNLLPIPPLDGAYLFFVSRQFFASVFVGVLTGALGYMAGVTGWLLVFLVVLGLVVGGWVWYQGMEKEDKK